MVFEKLGLNTTALTDVTPPSFNISNSSTEILSQIPEKANSLTGNFLGLGILSTLFFYLVYKFGQGTDQNLAQYSTTRTVGTASGICAIIGFQFLALGFFTEFYHVVIFAGIWLVATIIVYLEDKR